MIIPNDIISSVNTLLNEKIKLSNIHNDGRANSVLDEYIIVDKLCNNNSKFSKGNQKGNLRSFYDVLFTDENGRLYPINVKSSKISNINASNKLSLLWSFTNLPDDYFLVKTKNVRSMMKNGLI